MSTLTNYQILNKQLKSLFFLKIWFITNTLLTLSHKLSTLKREWDTHLHLHPHILWSGLFKLKIWLILVWIPLWIFMAMSLYSFLRLEDKGVKKNGKWKLWRACLYRIKILFLLGLKIEFPKYKPKINFKNHWSLRIGL